jgi:hypothetical protein
VQPYVKGDRVVQPQYGPGTIADANAEHTIIDFDNHGVRTFITSMVTLERTNEPAPVRVKATRRTKKAADTSRS